MSRPALSDKSPTVRMQLKWPHGLMDRVEDYRYANRIPSLSEAVRQLIERGLEAEKLGKRTEEHAA